MKKNRKTDVSMSMSRVIGGATIALHRNRRCDRGPWFVANNTGLHDEKMEDAPHRSKNRPMGAPFVLWVDKMGQI